MQDGTRMATFDYRIYEELKEMKKELRQARAMNNLVNLLATNEPEGEEAKADDEDDDFSMSISYDYGERDYDYGDPFADQQRGGQWRKDSGEDDQEEKDRKIEEILNRPPREDIDIIP